MSNLSRDFRLAARSEPRQDVARAYENAALEMDNLTETIRLLRGCLRPIVENPYLDEKEMRKIAFTGMQKTATFGR